MRVGLISDLHLDVNSQITGITVRMLARAVISAFLDYEDVDVFILAGDISASLRDVEILFQLFKKNNVNVYFVPGNHDIWVGEQVDANLYYKDAGFTSWDKYEVLLKQLSQKYYVNYVPKEPRIVNGKGIAGTIGWYDYSFRSRSYDIPLIKYRKKQLEGVGSLQDRKYAVWEIPDTAVARKMENDLRADILELIHKGVKEIIAVTHHIPYVEGIHYKKTLKWDFFAAFMGSKGLGEVIDEFAEVKVVTFGHTHINILIKKIHSKRSYCAPLGYLTKERQLSTDLSEGSLTRVISEAIHIFDL